MYKYFFGIKLHIFSRILAYSEHECPERENALTNQRRHQAKEENQTRGLDSSSCDFHDTV